MSPNDRVLVFIDGQTDPYTILRFLRPEMESKGTSQVRRAVIWSSLLRGEIKTKEKTRRPLRLNDQEYIMEVVRVSSDSAHVKLISLGKIRFKPLGNIGGP